jgi:CheY-like chemotaxis protein
MAEQPRSVLVVDDVVDAVDSLALLLTLYGFEVRTAPDGPSALASLTAGPPDVVLTDIKMPEMNGWEFVRRLRAQPGGTGIFVVVVTGFGQEKDIVKSAEAGADLHLLKPVSPDRLVTVLEGLRPVPPLSEA